MNRTFTLCFLLYPIALPFGYVLVYTFYHYAVPDANSNIEMLGTRVLFENNPPYKIGNNLSEIIDTLDGWSINMRANTFYVGIIFIGVAGYSLSGGSWNIIGCKTSNAYEWQMAIKYSENTGITVTARSKINNIWNSWGNIT